MAVDRVCVQREHLVETAEDVPTEVLEVVLAEALLGHDLAKLVNTLVLRGENSLNIGLPVGLDLALVTLVQNHEFLVLFVHSHLVVEFHVAHILNRELLHTVCTHAGLRLLESAFVFDLDHGGLTEALQGKHHCILLLEVESALYLVVLEALLQWTEAEQHYRKAFAVHTP